MATPKQIAANRANAQKSTGPRTEAGKAITRLNAVKDGLTGQLLLIAPEEHDAWLDFSQRLTASLAPVGIEELHVAARIVRDTWRLHRIAAIEETAYTRGHLSNPLAPATTPAEHHANTALSHSLTFDARAAEFNRASLIEARLRRGLNSDYALLHRLRKERPASLPESAAQDAHPSDAPALSAHNPPASAPPIGSVFEIVVMSGPNEADPPVTTPQPGPQPASQPGPRPVPPPHSGPRAVA